MHLYFKLQTSYKYITLQYKYHSRTIKQRSPMEPVSLSCKIWIYTLIICINSENLAIVVTRQKFWLLLDTCFVQIVDCQLIHNAKPGVTMLSLRSTEYVLLSVVAIAKLIRWPLMSLAWLERCSSLSPPRNNLTSVMTFPDWYAVPPSPELGIFRRLQ